MQPTKYLLTLLFACLSLVAAAQQKEANFFLIEARQEAAIKALNATPDARGQTDADLEGGETARFYRWQHLWRHRLGPNGEMDVASQYLHEYLSTRGTEKGVNCADNPSATIGWTPLGPFNSDGARNQSNDCANRIDGLQNQGRVEAISPHPDNPNDILAGAINGGVWRSTDGGVTWANQTDDEGFSTYGVGKFVRHPQDPDIVYGITTLGIGNWESRRTVYTAGVLLSTDGGSSWQSTGFGFNNRRHVVDLAIDPASTLADTRLFLAERSRIYVWEGDYQAAGSWEKIVENYGWQGGPLWWGVVGFVDIAATHDGAALFSDYHGVYRYADGEITEVTNFTLPAAWQNLPDCGNNGQSLRQDFNLEVNAQGDIVMLGALSRCNNSGGYTYGAVLYRSIDDGLTWSAPVDVTGQVRSGHTRPKMIVDDYDSDVIYSETGFRCVTKTSNFGQSFATTDNGENHVDIRCFATFTGGGPASQRIYVGTDGGLSVTTDGNYWQDITGEGMVLTNFYGVGITEADDRLILAGAQDGSINFFQDGDWYETQPGGDNGDCLISPLDEDRVIQEYQNAIVRGTINGTDISYSFSYSEAGTWMNPLEWNRANPTEYFFGTRRLFIADPNSGNETAIYDPALHGQRHITSVATSRATADVVYYSTDGYYWGLGASNDGGIFRADRTDGNWTLTDVTSNLRQPVADGLEGLKATISDITVDPNDENRVWISRGNFSEDHKVFYSEDGGVNWKNWTKTGLPNLPCTSIAYQESSNDVVYVGTDAGVFYYNKDSDCWLPYGSGGPQCMVGDMEINHCAGKLVVATQGRGIWEVPLLRSGSELVLPVGNTIWDTDRSVAGDVRIPAGATLTVNNATIGMGQDVKITIEAGGKLALSFATLTNGCGYTWNGIKLDGDSEAGQSASLQPVFEAFHATVEHATEALEPRNHSASNSGAIIDAVSTRFLNNKRSVALLRYEVATADVRFADCTFLTDGNYRHANTLMTHVSMWDVEGPRFEGCHFLNEKEWAFSDRVSGIIAIDVDFTVDRWCENGVAGCTYHRSTFAGLHRAIDVSREYDGKVFGIYNADFRNNYYGILVGTANNFSIRNNNFEVGSTWNVSGPPVHEGIVVNSGTGYTIDQNAFTPSFTTTSPTTVGIRIKDSGSEANLIYNNTFTKSADQLANVFYANLANGTNREACAPFVGLEYHCNRNVNNVANGYDFVATDAGIAYRQGSLDQAAGNVFSLGTAGSGAPIGSDFFNGAYTGSLTYYYRNLSGQNPNNTFEVSELLTGSTHTCPDRYDPDGIPERADFETDFVVASDEYRKLRAELDRTGNSGDPAARERLTARVALAKSECLRVCNAALRAGSEDKVPATEYRVQWLTRKATPEADMALADVFLAEGKVKDTRAVLERIRAASKKLCYLDETEVIAFLDLKEIQISLHGAGVSVLDIPANYLTQIRAIADRAGGLAGDQARAIMNRNGGDYFVPPVLPERKGESKPTAKTATAVTPSPTVRLRALPNPARDRVTLTFGDPVAVDRTVTLTNQAGGELRRWSLPALTDRLEVNVRTLPVGLYLYTLVGAAGENGQHTGKLLVVR